MYSHQRHGGQMLFQFARFCLVSSEKRIWMRWTSVWVGLRRMVVLKNHYRYRVSFNKRFHQYATSTSTHQPSKRMKYEEREPVTVLPSGLPLVCTSTQSKQFTKFPLSQAGQVSFVACFCYCTS